MQMDNELIQYVKDDRGEKIGCVVAHGPDKIGWSLCHNRDQFCKKTAKEMARQRLNIPAPVEVTFVKGTPSVAYSRGSSIDTIKDFYNNRLPSLLSSLKYSGYYHAYKFDLLYKEIEKMKERAKRYYK